MLHAREAVLIIPTLGSPRFQACKRGPLPLPICVPPNSYQAGQDIRSNEHVEDVVPARGGYEPGQQRPQSRTCAEHCIREGPGAGAPPSNLKLCPRPGSGRRESQTYGSSAVDDGCDSGQRLGVTLQALVRPLERDTRVGVLGWGLN